MTHAIRIAAFAVFVLLFAAMNARAQDAKTEVAGGGPPPAPSESAPSPALKPADIARLAPLRIELLEMEKQFALLNSRLNACSSELIESWTRKSQELQQAYAPKDAAYRKLRDEVANGYPGMSVTADMRLVKAQENGQGQAQTQPQAPSDSGNGP